ncbi:aminoglycoside 3'-phosphotransferase [Saccharopolyspora taberi]|uniref:Aminoglycoside 3'-phosphotransferase n=1 Tax=Saccharopolyspora taberi TaxID=60895 RepID=A0ABN3V879_9PSEU
MLTAVGADAVWSRDHEGNSGGVWKVSGAAGTFFARCGQTAALEHQRLRWLAGRIEVPAVAAFADGEQPWLVLADVRAPSLPAARLSDPAEAGTIMGRLLRRLHSLPVRDCPFRSPVATLVDQARRRVAENLVDHDDFDDDHRGATPGALLERLVELRPPDADLAVTHGDFCPDNVLLRPDGSAVLIDVSRLGVADRHRDIALARRNLADDFGTEAVDAFTAASGFDPDPDRLYWYRLLDEFF